MEDFNIQDKPFEWADLVGKMLYIFSIPTNDGNIILGMDVKNKENLYVLHWDLPKGGSNVSSSD